MVRLPSSATLKPSGRLPWVVGKVSRCTSVVAPVHGSRVRSCTPPSVPDRIQIVDVDGSKDSPCASTGDTLASRVEAPEDGSISRSSPAVSMPIRAGRTLPIPLPSFGLGGEAGVGGEYDNGERFDLRLPYVDQGYEDPDADVMGKLMDLFKKKPPKEEE